MHSAHLIWPTYGTWVPPAPRGTWEKFVSTWERVRQGSHAHDIEPSADDPYRLQRELARRARSYPAVRLDGQQLEAVAQGIERYLRGRRIWVWAAALLPDHVQLVLTSRAEQPGAFSNQLRGEATKRLNELKLHPLRGFLESNSQHPMMWSPIKWHADLPDDDAIGQAILYVKNLSHAEQTITLDPKVNFLKTFQSLRVCREEAEEYSV